MRMRSVMLLAIAAGCGLVAMFLFQQVASRTTGAVEEKKVMVLVAQSEITPGSKLDEKNTAFREFPVSVVPPNVITTKEEFADRCIKIRAFTGDVITLDKLSRKGQIGLSNEIPSGMVAITIGVDNSMTSAGLLGPGDKVDVMVTYRSANQAGLGKQIKTVLEYVEVFAADEKRDQSAGGETKAKTITLIMTAEQAKLLKLAEDIGKLHLAMRSREDSTPRAQEKDRFNPEEAEAARALAQLEDGETSAKQKEALQAFLDAQAAATQPTVPSININVAPSEPAAPPPVPKWSIEIYAGDQKRVEEVDYPEGELPPTPKAASSNPIVNGLKSLFGGGAEPQAEPTTSTRAVQTPGPILPPPTSGPSNSQQQRASFGPKRTTTLRK